MKGHYWKILGFALLLPLGGVVLFLLYGEQFLRINNDDNKRKTDAVVILAGAPFLEDRQRILEGAKLYQQGRGRYIILPLRHATFKWSWVETHYELVNSIPETQIIVGRRTAEDKPEITQFGGTFVEAQKTVRIMHKHQLKSAIIVSSAYHMRRTKIAFDQVRSNPQLQFYFHPVDHTLNPELPWWRDGKYFRRVLGEYKKLLAAYFIYNQKQTRN
jgi:uncharacterized SAM-binding protein YcdF (DUF218 family)